MTDEEVTVTGVALEVATTNENHTRLERLVARALANYADDGSNVGPDASPSVMLSEKYSGPFAHPAVLADLDKVLENGAERGFCLTEREQSHRHEIERAEAASIIKHRESVSTDRRITIVCIFTFMLLCLTGAFIAVMTDHTAGAGLLGGGGAIVTALALFFARSRLEKASPDASG